MRWIPFVILVCLLVLIQTTLGRVLTLSDTPVGPIGPDLLAIMAVFVALQARSGYDAAMAGWVLGMGLDLTAAGGVTSPTVVGPMPVAYVLAAALVYWLREAVFRERALIQGVLAALFCLLAHGIWVTAQSLRAAGQMTWSAYWDVMLQVMALAAYTALLMPLGYWLLDRLRRLFMTAAVGRSRHRRR